MFNANNRIIARYNKPNIEPAYSLTVGSIQYFIQPIMRRVVLFRKIIAIS